MRPLPEFWSQRDGGDPDVGAVRLSLVHHNTEEEIAPALDVLDQVL